MPGFAFAGAVGDGYVGAGEVAPGEAVNPRYDADSHGRIRNLAANTAALWLLESGILVRRPEENPYRTARYGPVILVKTGVHRSL